MKKAVRKKKSIPKKLTLFDRLPKNHGERLELIIKYTERAITNPEYQSDLINQVIRLKAELEEWRKSNK